MNLQGSQYLRFFTVAATKHFSPSPSRSAVEAEDYRFSRGGFTFSSSASGKEDSMGLLFLLSELVLGLVQ